MTETTSSFVIVIFIIRRQRRSHRPPLGHSVKVHAGCPIVHPVQISRVQIVKIAHTNTDTASSIKSGEAMPIGRVKIVLQGR